MNKKTLNSKQLDQLADIAINCRYDPLKWANVAWNWGHGDLTNKKIRNWQAEVMAEIGRHIQDPAKRHTPLRIAVASGHGIGKSACIGMISNWAMSCWRGARVLATANTEDQIRTKTSPEVATWFRRSISALLFSIDTMSIKSREQSELPWVMDFVSWSEHNTEAFAGLHAEGRIILLIMDEASAISSKVWEVAEGALTDENTVIIWLAFGNFTRNVGRFRECFRKNRKYWTTKQIDSREVEGTNKDFLNGLVEQYGEDSDFVKVRVRGMPPSAASRQLIPTHLVDQAFGRHLQRVPLSTAPHSLSMPISTAPHSLSVPISAAPHSLGIPFSTAPHSLSVPISTAPHSLSVPISTAPHSLGMPFSSAPHSLGRSCNTRTSKGRF
jgi:hypothetical protein